MCNPCYLTKCGWIMPWRVTRHRPVLHFLVESCRYAHRIGEMYKEINAAAQAHKTHWKSSYVVGVSRTKCPLNSAILIKYTSLSV